MNAKDRKKEAAKVAAMQSHCTVYGEARVIGEDGVEKPRIVRLWPSLPSWWNQSQPDQREEWLRGFFSRQLNLKAGEKLVGVRSEIHERNQGHLIRAGAEPGVLLAVQEG